MTDPRKLTEEELEQCIGHCGAFRVELSGHIAAIEAAGAAWFPLVLARELDDAILSMRTNELEIGTWVFKTAGDAAAMLEAGATRLGLSGTRAVLDGLG